MNGQSGRAAAAALRGAPADAHPAAHRALHGAAGRRRAVPVQRGTRRAGRGQPAVRHPLRRRARLRRLPGAAQAPARGRARRTGGGRRARTTSTSRPSRPRSRTCGTSPSCSPTRAPVERAGRLLAASRPLPVLGLRAAASQACGFAYFAAKVHPDVRLLRRGRHDARTTASTPPCAPGPARCSASRCPATRKEVVDALAYAQDGRADRGHGRRLGVRAGGQGTRDLLLPAAVGTGLAFDTACAPMLLGRVLLEAMCDDLPDAQARLEEFDARAAARGLFVE